MKPIFIPVWKEVVLDFGPWPGEVCTYVKPLEIVGSVWGNISRSEIRRRIERGNIKTWDYVWHKERCEYILEVRTIGFGAERVYPDDCWFIWADRERRRGYSTNLVVFRRGPMNVWERLAGAVLQEFIYGFIGNLQDIWDSHE